MTVLDDTLVARPWYREPWPWILMAGPLAVVAAGFVTLWLAIASDDGLVADDYYKQGLAINQTLARAREATRLSLSARVTMDMQARRVRAVLGGAAAPPRALRLRLVHPTRAVADIELVLRAVEPGVYEADAVPPLDGRRVMVIEDVARSWRLTGESAGAMQAVVLAPQ